MSGGEIAVLAFIVASFVAFGVTLAWLSHGEGSERQETPPRPAPQHQEHSGTSYQGADG